MPLDCDSYLAVGSFAALSTHRESVLTRSGRSRTPSCVGPGCPTSSSPSVRRGRNGRSGSTVPTVPVSRSSPQPRRAGLGWPSNRRRCRTAAEQAKRDWRHRLADLKEWLAADRAAAPQVRQADQLSGHLGGSQGQIGSSQNRYAKFTSGQHLASKHIIQALARPPDGVTPRRHCAAPEGDNARIMTATHVRNGRHVSASAFISASLSS